MNPFERFRGVSVDEWVALVERSVAEPVIDGVEFPGFPESALQERIHGNSGEHALEQAGRFYAFCREHYEPGGRLLDFGCGWGRIMRAFIRDFPLEGLYGYEPNPELCLRARRLNPYVAWINGPYRPPSPLPRAFFDVVVAYSVFSHLPEAVTRAWMRELATTLRPGGVLVFTAYGGQWLGYADEPEARASYEAGRIALVGDGPDWYNAVLIPEAAVSDLIEGSGLRLVEVERSLAQDAIVLRLEEPVSA